MYSASKRYHVLKKSYKNLYATVNRLSLQARRGLSGEKELKAGYTLTGEQRQQIYDYWHKYTKDFNIDFHNHYINASGVFDVRYVPHDIYAGYISPYLNPREVCEAVCDKNYFDMYYLGLKMPETYLRLVNGQFLDKDYLIIPVEKAAKYLVKKGKFIAKPSTNSFGGKGIEIFGHVKYEDMVQYLTRIQNDGTDLIFQELLEQSAETALLHPGSLNTLRVTSLLLNGDVKILCTVFKVGVGGAKVDNATAGGLFCKVSPDGRLGDTAYNLKNEKFDRHPDGGEFSQCKIPCLDKVFDFVKIAAQRLPRFRLVGWDMALDKNNQPVLIEANLTMPGLWQEICGPLFGEWTDEVLEEVFLKPHKEHYYMDFDLWLKP
jgi:hypothetical protein